MGYLSRGGAAVWPLAFFLAASLSIAPAFAHKNNAGGGTPHYAAPKQVQPPRQTLGGARPAVGGNQNFSNRGANGNRTFGGNQNGGNRSNTRTFGNRSFSNPGGRIGNSRGPGSTRFPNNLGPHVGQHAPRRDAFGHHYYYNGRKYSAFRVGYYHGPHGYRYVRYGVGGYFPRQYWISNYYITDYAAFGLAPPPDDYQWVRYGPDAVLFDLDTGQIAQVIPGAFDQEAGADDDQGDGGDDGSSQ